MTHRLASPEEEGCAADGYTRPRPIDQQLHNRHTGHDDYANLHWTGLTRACHELVRMGSKVSGTLSRDLAIAPRPSNGGSGG